MLRKVLAAPALVLALAAPGAGCFFVNNPDSPTFEGDDVRMETPGQSGFRAAGDQGDVYELGHEIAADINLFVADLAGEMGEIVREANRHPAERTDGEWRVYGPADADDGEDIRWMLRVRGDSTSSAFEIYVGDRGAPERDLRVVLSGELVAERGVRDGSILIDFDVFARHPELIDADGSRYGGSIGVAFHRDKNTGEKDIELDFDNFFYEDRREAYDYGDETYEYHRDTDGSGTFHFATWSSFEDEGWSGPEIERLVVDMRWDGEGAGRAIGEVQEIDGQGDLRHGDLTVDECWDTTGGLVYADITEAYRPLDPDYSFGDGSECVFAVEDVEYEG